MTDTCNSGPKADKPKQGFAVMDKTKQLEIASKGGKAAHAQGKAHEWTSEEAATAGKKGGQVSRGGRGRLDANKEPNEDGRRRSPAGPNTKASE